MQAAQYQRNFCEARELITDKELRRLKEKYHLRHPTFSIDIQERTCKTILMFCVYHYRHIEIELQCQCLYNDVLHKFEFHWSTDNIEYKTILEEIFLRLKSFSTHRSLDDQIVEIMEQITKYFTQLKSTHTEEQQPVRTPTKNTSSPIHLVTYDFSPQQRRRQLVERSYSWSQALISRPARYPMSSMPVERVKKN